MKTFASVLGLVVALQAVALGQQYVDRGTPERGAGDGERIVVEVGVPAADSQEHAFVTHVARALCATRTWDGAYELDALIADLADPARRDGSRPKVSTLLFAGHMLYVKPDGGEIVRDPAGVEYGYLTAGRASYETELHAHLLEKLDAALAAKGLGYDDVFAPGALVEFKVCNGAVHARDLVEGLAKRLPRGAQVKAYDEGYVWLEGAYDFLWMRGRTHRFGFLGELLGEEARYRFNLGDQRQSLVVFEGGGATAVAPARKPVSRGLVGKLR